MIKAEAAAKTKRPPASGATMCDSASARGCVSQPLVLAGTVDSVVEQILALHQPVGSFGQLVCARHDCMDPAWDKWPMELPATNVLSRADAALAR